MEYPNNFTVAEKKIVISTIEFIEKYGLEAATIRRIADYAGVNSAAIGYYFRSKDKLIQIAMEQTLDNAFDMDDFSESEGKPVRERLIHVFTLLAEGAIQYPRLTRAHLHDTFIKGSYTSDACKRINEFFLKLEKEIIDSGYQMDITEMRMKLIQLGASVVFYMGVMPDLLTPFSELKLSDPETREKYIRILVESLFH